MPSENLIEEYVLSYNITRTTEYGNKASVRKHNRAMSKCGKIAVKIQTNYPELKEEFALLLDKFPDDIALLVAHHIIGYMQYPNDIKAKALSIIKDTSQKDSVYGFGNKIWLEKHLKMHPDDAELIK